MATHPFTILTTGQIAALVQAGASPAEWAAYALLTRHSPQLDGIGVYLSTEECAAITGMRSQTVRKALMSLTRREFPTEHGGVHIIERLTTGHRGHVATYRDNLYRERGKSVPMRQRNHEKALTDAATKGSPASTPKEVKNGSGADAPAPWGRHEDGTPRTMDEVFVG